jgi:hypothetical protein
MYAERTAPPGMARLRATDSVDAELLANIRAVESLAAIAAGTFDVESVSKSGMHDLMAPAACLARALYHATYIRPTPR